MRRGGKTTGDPFMNAGFLEIMSKTIFTNRNGSRVVNIDDVSRAMLVLVTVAVLFKLFITQLYCHSYHVLLQDQIPHVSPVRTGNAARRFQFSRTLVQGLPVIDGKGVELGRGVSTSIRSNSAPAGHQCNKPGATKSNGRVGNRHRRRLIKKKRCTRHVHVHMHAVRTASRGVHQNTLCLFPFLKHLSMSFLYLIRV